MKLCVRNAKLYLTKINKLHYWSCNNRKIMKIPILLVWHRILPVKDMWTSNKAGELQKQNTNRIGLKEAKIHFKLKLKGRSTRNQDIFKMSRVGLCSVVKGYGNQQIRNEFEVWKFCFPVYHELTINPNYANPIWLDQNYSHFTVPKVMILQRTMQKNRWIKSNWRHKLINTQKAWNDIFIWRHLNLQYFLNQW